MLRTVALTFSCAVLALTAAACGQSASGGDGDPASLVPANAPVYLQVAVQPEGQRRDDALAATGKLLRTDDPAGKLRELVDKQLAEQDAGVTWERDFAPWLGEEAGVWATNLEGEQATYAAIFSTKDAEAAKAALPRLRGGANEFSKHTHGGVEYEIDEESSTAYALVDDFVVIGSEDALKRTIDMRDGGEKLADSDRYASAMDDLEDDRLGQYFIDMKVLMDAAIKQDPQSAAQFEQFRSLFPFDKLGPLAGSLQANGDHLAIDSVMTGLPEGPVRTLTQVFSGGGSELTSGLPGDAWAAFALPKLGEAAKVVVTSFAGAIGGAAAAVEFKRATGLDLEQDVFSWVGDAGVFVRGASESALDGALVIQSTDDAKASAAFGKIIGLIGKDWAVQPEPIQVAGAESAFSLAAPDLEKPIVLARGKGRVVAAYGEEAAAAALDPATKLGDSELYRDAKDALADGMEPGFLLSMPAVITLVDAIGEADADYADAKPYLESLGAVTTGGKVDGDTAKSRIAVTLK
jgi:hypothetical protein